MTDNTQVTEAEVVTTPEVVSNPQLDKLNAQEADFKNQLTVAKNDMVKLQQQFDAIKTKAIKLEGAIESLAILRTSLTAPASK